MSIALAAGRVAAALASRAGVVFAADPRRRTERPRGHRLLGRRWRRARSSAPRSAPPGSATGSTSSAASSRAAARPGGWSRYDISEDRWARGRAAADRRQPPRGHRPRRPRLPARRQPLARATRQVASASTATTPGATAGSGSPTRRRRARRSALGGIGDRLYAAGGYTDDRRRPSQRSRSTTSSAIAGRPGPKMPTGRNHVGAAVLERRAGRHRRPAGPGPRRPGDGRALRPAHATAGRRLRRPGHRAQRPRRGRVGAAGGSRRLRRRGARRRARRSSRSRSSTRRRRLGGAARRWSPRATALGGAAKGGRDLRARGRPAAGPRLLARARVPRPALGELSRAAGGAPGPRRRGRSRRSSATRTTPRRTA